MNVTEKEGGREGRELYCSRAFSREEEPVGEMYLQLYCKELDYLIAGLARQVQNP